MPIRTPLLTVDVVIQAGDPRRVVLIERANPPSGWALPGGFVEVGETVESAAAREVREETGLDVGPLRLLGVYSDPTRDPRGHTVSVVFVGRADGQPVGGDDAAAAAVFDLDRLPTPVAFDHLRILADYAGWLGGSGAEGGVSGM